MNDHQPTRADCYEMLLALAPSGRAWQSNEAAGVRTGSVIKRFWYAVAGPWFALEGAISATLAEWSPATTARDRDLWLADFGLPDRCDPAGDDLATKVAALGSAQEVDWPALAEKLGIVATFRYLKGDPADPDLPGVRATLLVKVDGAASSPLERRPPQCGTWLIGVQRLGNESRIDLPCMIEKNLPAHLDYVVEVV